MTYAAPLAYASKSLTFDPYAPMSASQHARPTAQRRRRLRALVLPALRPRVRAAAPAELATQSSRS